MNTENAEWIMELVKKMQQTAIEFANDSRMPIENTEYWRGNADAYSIVIRALQDCGISAK